MLSCLICEIAQCDAVTLVAKACCAGTVVMAFGPSPWQTNAVQKVTSCVVHATDMQDVVDALLTHTQPPIDRNRALATFQRQSQSFPQILGTIKRLPQLLEFRIPYRVRVELGILRFRIPNSVNRTVS